ncbi:MAG: hypothetical protein ACXV6K_08310 [Halobacteriota archaeon]
MGDQPCVRAGCGVQIDRAEDHWTKKAVPSYVKPAMMSPRD